MVFPWRHHKKSLQFRQFSTAGQFLLNISKKTDYDRKKWVILSLIFIPDATFQEDFNVA